MRIRHRTYADYQKSVYLAAQRMQDELLAEQKMKLACPIGGNAAPCGDCMCDHIDKINVRLK
jgi:hypothetical protein